MATWRRVANRAILCLALVMGSPASWAQTTELVLGNGEWAPYYGEHLPGQGADSTVVREAFALAGVKVRYVFLPWARVIAQARAHDGIVGAVGWADKPEYRRDFWVSDTTMSYQMVLFQRANDTFQWQRLADLRDKRIGLVLGYDYPQSLLDLVKARKLQVSWLANGEQGIRMVAADRLDYYPDDRVVGQLLINKVLGKQATGLAAGSLIINDDSLHLLLHKTLPGSAELMNRFNEGLARLRANGRLAQIQREMQSGAFSPP